MPRGCISLLNFLVVQLGHRQLEVPIKFVIMGSVELRLSVMVKLDVSFGSIGEARDSFLEVGKLNPNFIDGVGSPQLIIDDFVFARINVMAIE